MTVYGTLCASQTVITISPKTIALQRIFSHFNFRVSIKSQQLSRNVLGAVTLTGNLNVISVLYFFGDSGPLGEII